MLTQLAFLLKQVKNNGHFLEINKKIKPDRAMTQKIDSWMEDIIVAKTNSMHDVCLIV